VFKQLRRAEITVRGYHFGACQQRLNEYQAKPLKTGTEYKRMCGSHLSDGIRSEASECYGFAHPAGFDLLLQGVMQRPLSEDDQPGILQSSGSRECLNEHVEALLILQS